MRYAIFSDIHGNRQAWDAVAADMERLEVQVRVCLGDVVGYGPRPLEVLRAIRQATENVVVGNHDAAAAGTMDASVFNPVAREALEWTRGHLDEESLSFLARLPRAIESDDLLFVHAEVIEPGRFGYIETAEDARQNFAVKSHHVTFVGHTHSPTLFCLEENGAVTQWPDVDRVLEKERRYIVNVGSVGEPRSLEDIRASYVIYDSDSRKLYFRRIAFDPEAYREDLASSGLEITPFFLTIVDHQRAEEAAVRAMAEGVPATMAPSGDPALGVRSLVVPTGIAGGTSGMAVPRSQPYLRRRKKGVHPALVVLSLLALLVGGAIVLAVRNRAGNESAFGSPVSTTGQTVLPVQEEISIFGPAEEALAFNRPPEEAAHSAKDGTVGPRPDNAQDRANTPAGAIVPAPQRPASKPPDGSIAQPAPEPEPEPEPEPGPGPGPGPAVAEVPAMEGLGEGLLFYAPFDEPAGAQIARDLSPGGRDLNVAGARVGEAGQVALACQVDNSGGVTSAGQPLPATATWQGLTLSFWLRIPPKPVPKEGEAMMPDPPGNLVSLHEYVETRIENRQIVANLDRMGEDVRVDFPQDDRWHHIVVENAGGITSISIDGGNHSGPLAETLPNVPPGAVAVSIGAPESRFIIDEVAIWNRAFSRDDRLKLYRRGQQGAPVLAPARTLALWRFEDEPGAKLLRDWVGSNLLGVYGSSTRVPALAPDPVPLNDRPNRFAVMVSRVGEAPEKSGTFQMTAEAPFTYEGWVKFPGMATGGTLGGTLSGGEDDGAHGWRVAARRERGANGYLAFIYETGEEKVQALPENPLPLFDDQAHHFAAIWDPKDSETHGKMALYFDNQEVAHASLALNKVRPDAPAPFRIEAERAPIVLDELRFSALALKPEIFLTANQSPAAADDLLHQGESILERRDRERKEERLRQNEERLRKEVERQREEAERQREIEERKAEEESKRNRDKLGID